MKWLHFILSHSFFIALCAAALNFQTYQLLHMPVNGLIILFVAAATLCGYNGYWLLSKITGKQNTPFGEILKNNAEYVIIIIAAALIMFYCMLNLHLVYYNIIVTFLLLVAYSIPLWPLKKFAFVKTLGFVKTILLAFAWAHVTVLIPLQKPMYMMTQNEWLFFISRFLFLLMLCIIFDSRDIVIDKIRGLHSLATDLSPLVLKIFISAVFILLVVVNYMLPVTLLQRTALLLAATTALIAWFFAAKKRGYFFYYFFVDGLMFLSALMTLIVS